MTDISGFAFDLCTLLSPALARASFLDAETETFPLVHLDRQGPALPIT